MRHFLFAAIAEQSLVTRAIASDFSAKKTVGSAAAAHQAANVRMIQVRHRSYAMHSRQPRQVRKEATVTGSCVCSGFPVPGYFHFQMSSSLLSLPQA